MHLSFMGRGGLKKTQKGGGVLDIVICIYTKNIHLIEIFHCHIKNLI